MGIFEKLRLRKRFNKAILLLTATFVLSGALDKEAFAMGDRENLTKPSSVASYVSKANYDKIGLINNMDLDPFPDSTDLDGFKADLMKNFIVLKMFEEAERIRAVFDSNPDKEELNNIFSQFNNLAAGLKLFGDDMGSTSKVLTMYAGGKIDLTLNVNSFDISVDSDSKRANVNISYTIDGKDSKGGQYHQEYNLSSPNLQDHS